MKTPMPSPNGTNRERLYLQGAAYDAATGLSRGRTKTIRSSDIPAIRSAFARAGIAFDEADFLKQIQQNSRAKDEGDDIASRIMNALRQSGDFDDDEMAAIEQALSNAGISDMTDASQALASDRALGGASFDQRFGTGRIKTDVYEALRDRMFPHYNRLKG